MRAQTVVCLLVTGGSLSTSLSHRVQTLQLCVRLSVVLSVWLLPLLVGSNTTGALSTPL